MHIVHAATHLVRQLLLAVLKQVLVDQVLVLCELALEQVTTKEEVRKRVRVAEHLREPTAGQQDSRTGAAARTTNTSIKRRILVARVGAAIRKADHGLQTDCTSSTACHLPPTTGSAAPACTSL